MSSFHLAWPNRWSAGGAVLLVALSGCAGSAEQPPDLSVPVGYEMDGAKFEVPLGYHYYDSVKRKGRWPRPKEGFAEAGAIAFTALWPGMRPYSEIDKAEFETLGFGNKINVRISPRGELYPIDEWLARMHSGNRLEPVLSDLDGLTRYWDNYGGTDEGQGSDIYIKDGMGAYFKLDCPRVQAPSPACSVMKEAGRDLQIHYSFAKAHLPAWREIDRDVENLIESFAAE